MNTTPSVRATTLSRTSEERGPDMSVRTWLPLIALVCCVFLLNFSEFAPIGLLTDISKDFGISESTTGLIISVYAWAVAILSLPLMLLLRRMQYRPMLLMCIALFVVFQVITGLSNSYGMLMVSRLGVAVSHSIFWSATSAHYAIQYIMESQIHTISIR